MGGLVLTRRAGESIVFKYGSKEAVLTLESFSRDSAAFTFNGEPCIIRRSELFPILGGTVSWLPGKMQRDQIRFQFDIPRSVNIVRTELL